MNKYLIPICDTKVGAVWIQVITARSFIDCQEKLIEELSDMYDIEECNNYRDFEKVADEKYNILIGSIEDIEEI